MGCDIHCFAERYFDGAWHLLAPSVEARPWRFGQPGPDPRFTYTGVLRDWFDSRNYDLFGILADVRNGIGFAGIRTGDAWPVIEEPRGIPADASDLYRKEAEEWGIDGHSHSWFTVEELDRFFAGMVMGRKTGVVHCNDYAQGEIPHMHASDVSGLSSVILTEDQFAQVKDEIHQGQISREAILHFNFDHFKHKRPVVGVYVRQEWDHPAELVTEGFRGMLDELRKFGAPDELRVVFFFDN